MCEGLWCQRRVLAALGVGDVACLDAADDSARGGMTVHSEFSVPCVTANNIIGAFWSEKAPFSVKIPVIM